MKRYDALKAPDSAAWLALDELERISRVADYHRRLKIRLPNLQVHAAIHVIVENQLADAALLVVRETLQRLMAGGLDRHDAIHAIGSVLAEHLHSAMTGNSTAEFGNEAYFASLKTLTRESWYRDYGPEDEQ